MGSSLKYYKKVGSKFGLKKKEIENRK